MTALRTTLVVFTAILCAHPSVFAATFLSANITHDQETVRGPLTNSITGAPRPTSFGTATFTLNDGMTAMTFSATIFNIDVTGSQTPDTNDNLVAAHIHASPTVTLGTNAPVVWGFFGAPDNDINPDDIVVTPFSSGVGGVFTSKWDASEGNNTTLLAQLPNILSNHSYINFHTTQFGGGEIRGTITVPDRGATAVLLGCSLLAIAALRRKWTNPERPSIA